MLNKFEKEILNKLIDKYENSKSFLESNKVKQSFTLSIKKEFPKYTDHAEFEVYEQINEAIEHLIRETIITAKKERNGSYSKIELCTERLETIYGLLKRIPKKNINKNLKEVLEQYIKSDNRILYNYAKEQLENMQLNKKVKYFEEDIEAYKKLIAVVEEVFKIEQEIFIRDFSINFFKDSKEFEKIEGKVKSLIYEYGDFPEKDSILEELNIIKTPTYVSVKGSGILQIGAQFIDLSKISGDIALSSITLADIKGIQVIGNKVVTIENLTSFHTFNDQEALVIYLGGFHNSIRRKFLKQIHQDNPDSAYFHFGDIDAGGFYIFEHLRKMTGIPFETYAMNITTLLKYKDYWKELTANDKIRLSKLNGMEYKEVILFMLENNCKLEQEIIKL